jgi:hypothetical protein
MTGKSHSLVRDVQPLINDTSFVVCKILNNTMLQSQDAVEMTLFVTAPSSQHPQYKDLVFPGIQFSAPSAIGME